MHAFKFYTENVSIDQSLLDSCVHFTVPIIIKANLTGQRKLKCLSSRGCECKDTKDIRYLDGAQNISNLFVKRAPLDFKRLPFQGQDVTRGRSDYNRAIYYNYKRYECCTKEGACDKLPSAAWMEQKRDASYATSDQEDIDRGCYTDVYSVE